MHEKKENIYKGLVIFLLFCFGFTWLYDFVVIRNIAVVNDERLISILTSCGMYFPLIAHLSGIISYNFNTYEVSRINPIHLAFILQIPIYILGIICFYHLKNSRDYS